MQNHLYKIMKTTTASGKTTIWNLFYGDSFVCRVEGKNRGLTLANLLNSGKTEFGFTPVKNISRGSFISYKGSIVVRASRKAFDLLIKFINENKKNDSDNYFTVQLENSINSFCGGVPYTQGLPIPVSVQSSRPEQSESQTLLPLQPFNQGVYTGVEVLTETSLQQSSGEICTLSTKPGERGYGQDLFSTLEQLDAHLRAEVDNCEAIIAKERENQLGGREYSPFLISVAETGIGIANLRRGTVEVAITQSNIRADQQRIGADQQRIGADQQRIGADQQRTRESLLGYLEEQRRFRQSLIDELEEQRRFRQSIIELGRSYQIELDCE